MIPVTAVFARERVKCRGTTATPSRVSEFCSASEVFMCCPFLFHDAVTPPGFYTANGQTQQCPDGSFRPNWLPAAEAANCTACGEGLQATKSDGVTVHDIVSGQPRDILVMTRAEDCCKCC